MVNPDNADVTIVLALSVLFVAGCWMLFVDGTKAIACFVGCLVLVQIIAIRLKS